MKNNKILNVKNQPFGHMKKTHPYSVLISFEHHSNRHKTVLSTRPRVDIVVGCNYHGEIVEYRDIMVLQTMFFPATKTYLCEIVIKYLPTDDQYRPPLSETEFELL
jgi:hypothetical protein